MNHPSGGTGLAPSLADTVWLSTAQAATYTGRHTETVLAAAGDGRLESVQAGRGRGRRYRREWLDAWVTGVPARRTRTARTA